MFEFSGVADTTAFNDITSGGKRKQATIHPGEKKQTRTVGDSLHVWLLPGKSLLKRAVLIRSRKERVRQRSSAWTYARRRKLGSLWRQSLGSEGGRGGRCSGAGDTQCWGRWVLCWRTEAAATRRGRAESSIAPTDDQVKGQGEEARRARKVTRGTRQNCLRLFGVSQGEHPSANVANCGPHSAIVIFSPPVLDSTCANNTTNPRMLW